MLVSALEVEADQQLVDEQSSQDLSPIVIEPAVPNSVVQLEHAFEVIVERLNRLAATRINSSKPFSLKASPTRLP